MDDIEKLINKYPPSHKLDEPTWGKDAIREMIAEAKAGQHETIVMLPKHVIEEIEILCSLVIDSSKPNPIEANSARAILKNIKEAT